VFIRGVNIYTFFKEVNNIVEAVIIYDYAGIGTEYE